MRFQLQNIAQHVEAAIAIAVGQNQRHVAMTMAVAAMLAAAVEVQGPLLGQAPHIVLRQMISLLITEVHKSTMVAGQFMEARVCSPKLPSTLQAVSWSSTWTCPGRMAT